jgi:energy-coupling factor transporter ATP-binding protein EcfA2
VRLVELRIARAPGIDTPFELDPEALDRPVVLIVGPNGSGKTTLVRSVRALLWPELAPARVRIELGAGWRSGDERLEATHHPDTGTRWWRDGVECAEPSLPPGHLSPCFTLGALDLLKPETDAQDARLTGMIRRQLAGGYDLDQLLDARFPREPRGGAREAREYREARRALMEVRRREDQLAEQEAGLDELRAELQRARQAAAEAEQRDRQLAKLEALEHRLGEIEDDAREQRERIEGAERELETVALGDEPPSEADLEVHRRLTHRARECEQRLRELDIAAARAASTRDRARRALGAEIDAEGAPEVTAESLHEWEELSVALEDLSARRRALAEEIETLSAEEPDEARRRHREQAERALAEWLASPRGGGLAWGLAAVASLLGLALAAGAAWAARTGAVGPAGWAVAAAALLAVLAGWIGVTRRAVSQTRRRRERERLVEGLDVPPPAAWDDASVYRRLEELRRERAEDARAVTDAQRAEKLRRRLERVEADLEQRRAEAAELQRRFGLAARAGAARTAHVLRHLSDWQAARKEATELETERQEMARRLDEALGRIGALLDRHGGEPPADAEEASVRLEELDRRLAQAAAADRAIDDAQRTLRKLDEQRRHAEQAREELLEQGGLRGLDAAELQRRVRQLAERSDELAGRIREIETLVGARRQGHELQDALASAEAARQRLLDRRAQLARNAAGRVLVRRVEARHQEEQQPAVLRAASHLLARFTGYRYELEIASDPGGRGLCAREAAGGRSLDPEQLSDGTRAQLLLALRLAFAQQVEPGTPMPLLLDEALVASDPERFDAIADSLVQLAAETGRQVIFLTSHPHDAARWHALMRRHGMDPPEPVDLLGVRRGQRAARCPLPPAPAPGEPVPPPDGHDASSYGRRLGVEAPDPWAGIDAWHPLHLWPADLDAVHALVRHGLDRVGRWRLFRKHRPGDPGPLDGTRAERLDAAAIAGEAVLRGWRVGRGRPLDRETLAAAEAASERYVDELWGKARELGGDADALVDALRRREVKGFRQDKIEQLARELRESGHIDPRERLPRETLIARARAALEAREASPVAFGEVVELVDVVLSWLDGPA